MCRLWSWLFMKYRQFCDWCSCCLNWPNVCGQVLLTAGQKNERSCLCLLHNHNQLQQVNWFRSMCSDSRNNLLWFHFRIFYNTLCLFDTLIKINGSSTVLFTLSNQQIQVMMAFSILESAILYTFIQLRKLKPYVLGKWFSVSSHQL